MTCAEHDNITRIICPYIKQLSFPQKMISIFNNSYVNFIRTCIDGNLYPICHVDYNFISSVNMDRIHPCFFYGYDDEKKLFFGRDNLDEGKFIDYIFGFDEIETSINSIQNSTERLMNKNLVIMEYIDYKYNPFNMKYLYNELQAYLDADGYSKQKMNNFSSFKSLNEEIAYVNLEIYDYFLEMFQSIHRYDRRMLYLFSEHKRIMNERIRFLVNKELIESTDELITLSDEVFSLSQRLLFLSLKLLEKGDLANPRLVLLLSEVKEKEIKMTMYLLQAIQRRYNY